MSLFAEIHEEARNHRLRFVIIGGLAINHFGFPRETADLDLFISQDDRDQWLKILSGFGYTIYHDGGDRLDISSNKIRELFNKYGTPDLYEKVSRALSNG